MHNAARISEFCRQVDVLDVAHTLQTWIQGHMLRLITRRMQAPPDRVHGTAVTPAPPQRTTPQLDVCRKSSNIYRSSTALHISGGT
jgi:hypothetical protein